MDIERMQAEYRDIVRKLRPRCPSCEQLIEAYCLTPEQADHARAWCAAHPTPTGCSGRGGEETTMTYNDDTLTDLTPTPQPPSKPSAWERFRVWALARKHRGWKIAGALLAALLVYGVIANIVDPTPTSTSTKSTPSPVATAPAPAPVDPAVAAAAKAKADAATRTAKLQAETKAAAAAKAQAVKDAAKAKADAAAAKAKADAKTKADQQVNSAPFQHAEDVKILSVRRDPDVYWPIARVQITNHSSKASDYSVSVAFQSRDGRTQLDTGDVYVSRLAPGQTTVQEATGFAATTNRPFKAVLTDVSRTSTDG